MTESSKENKKKPRNNLGCDCDRQHPTTAVRKLVGRSVAFLFDRNSKNWGSTWLRAKQLSRLLSIFDPDLEVMAESIQGYKGKHPDIAILSKTAITLDQSGHLISRMSRDGTKIVVDIVDGHPDITKNFETPIDAYICASASEYNYRIIKKEQSFLVHHHVDSRIPSIKPSSRKDFNAGYAGKSENALWIKDLPISILEVDTSDFSKGNTEFVRFLNKLTHHYSVRQYQDWDGFKPGTKLFLASHFGASFIGSKDDQESQILLGHEYPYTADSSSLRDVTSILEFAESTYGTEVHQKALLHMAHLRELSCRANVASALHEALATIV